MFCPPLSIPPAAARGDACSLMSAILLVMEALATDPAAKAIPEIRRPHLEPAGQQESEKTEQDVVKPGASARRTRRGKQQTGIRSKKVVTRSGVRALAVASKLFKRLYG